MVTNELPPFSTEEWQSKFRLNHYSTCSSSQSMALLEVFNFKYYLSLAVDHNVWLLRFPKSSRSESRSVVQHHLSLELEISQQISSSHLEVHVQSHHLGGSAIKTMHSRGVEKVNRSTIYTKGHFYLPSFDRQEQMHQAVAVFTSPNQIRQPTEG